MSHDGQKIASTPTKPQPASSDSVSPLLNVEGKVAFITGGDSGIGLGIARAFLDAGAKVVITYRSKAHLEEAMTVLGSAPDRVHAIDVDVTDRAAMAAAAVETIRVFSKVHILVNNAGVGPIIPLSSATFDDWDWCMNVNVNGAFNGIHAFLPHIRAHNEGGHICSTSSMLGGVIVGPFWGVYSTSKFAVVGMMEALRSELMNTNIGVSVFCPAGVQSNLRDSGRNRPATLSNSGASSAAPIIEEFGKSLRKVLESAVEAPIMDAAEAGRIVLKGIVNNDLYIFSHPEYEQQIRNRNEALLASIPRGGPPPTSGRMAVAQVIHTDIYARELQHKQGIADSDG